MSSRNTELSLCRFLGNAENELQDGLNVLLDYRDMFRRNELKAIEALRELKKSMGYFCVNQLEISRPKMRDMFRLGESHLKTLYRFLYEENES